MSKVKNKKDICDEYPQVVYESRKIKREVLSYLKYLGLECLSFEYILKDLGFNKDDVVYLYEYNDMKYLYSVNDKEINYDNIMYLNYGMLFEAPPSIVIKNIDEEIKYHCISDSDIVSFDKYYSIKRCLDDVIYTRNYCVDGYYGSIVKDDYKLNISLYNEDYNYYKEDIEILLCEKELEEYLVSLDFPIKIDEVYKRICEIIGKDIDKYNIFKIEVSENKITNNGFKKYNTIDIIKIDNGVIVEFGMTINNKTVFIDSDNNWSYKIMKDDGRVISITKSNDNFNYQVSNNKDMDFEMLFSQYFEEAKNEVDNVKTRVRSILKK